MVYQFKAIELSPFHYNSIIMVPSIHDSILQHVVLPDSFKQHSTRFFGLLNTFWFLLLCFVVFSMTNQLSMNMRINFHPLSLNMVYTLIHDAFSQTLSSDRQIKHFRLDIEWNLLYLSLLALSFWGHFVFSILENTKTISILWYWFLVLIFAFIIMEVRVWTIWNNSQNYRFSNSTMTINRYIASITYDCPGYLFMTIHSFMASTCKILYLKWKE